MGWHTKLHTIDLNYYKTNPIIFDLTFFCYLFHFYIFCGLDFPYFEQILHKKKWIKKNISKSWNWENKELGVLCFKLLRYHVNQSHSKAKVKYFIFFTKCLRYIRENLNSLSTFFYLLILCNTVSISKYFINN